MCTVTSAQPRRVLATTTGGAVTTSENGAYIWDGRVLDELEHNVDKPRTVVIIAVLVVAGMAIVLASLPALTAFGLVAARPEELTAGIAGLAVGVGAVLGAVKLVALAWHAGHRHRLRRPNSSIAASAD
jgi:hypothetical protein